MPVRLRVGLGVVGGVWEGVKLRVGVRVNGRVSVMERDGEAVSVDSDADAERLGLALPEGLGLRTRLPVPVPLQEGLWLGETVGRENVAVQLREGDAERLIVRTAVSEGREQETEGVRLGLRVSEGLAERVFVVVVLQVGGV